MFSSRAIACLAAVAGLWAGTAHAQLLMTHAGGAAAATYLGPADVVASPTAYYGVRAVNAAYATANGHMFTAFDSRNSHSCIFNAAANGGVGTTDGTCAQGGGLSVLQWATDGTCSGTIATTTLTCTGATVTPIAGETLNGAGITSHLEIASCGTFTAGSGTCTLTFAGPTISTPETITIIDPIQVNTWTDQTGNGHDGTQVFQPQFILVCANSLPCLHWSGSSRMTVPAYSVSQPYTISYVANRQSTVGYSSLYTAASQGTGFDTAGNKVYLASPTLFNATATDGLEHAFQNVANGASSKIDVDGTTTTGNAGASAFGSGGTIYIANVNNIQVFLGYITEIGMWPIAFSSGQITSMCHNQFSYWATVTSC